MSSSAYQNSQEIMTSMKDHKLFEGQALLYRHLFSFLNPMCLRWAIQLGIPTIIHNHGKPITLPELLSTLQVPPAKACFVPRFMRFLAHNGLFAIVRIHDNEEEAYVLTPASELLVEGTDHCLSPMIKSILQPRVFEADLKMGDWIYGEERTVYETAFGVSFWDFIHNNPEHMNGFNEAMAGDSKMLNLALSDCNSVFEGLESVVDVGGGNGATGKIICEAFPKLQYIVLDLPQVVANSSASGNLSYVGGNMFDSIPQADAVLLKVCMCEC